MLSGLHWKEGRLVASVDGRVRSFARPCELARVVPPGVFAGFGRPDGAWRTVGAEVASVPCAEPLRGDPGEFLMWIVRWKPSIEVAVLSAAAMSCTVRLEDVRDRLPAEARFARCAVTVRRDVEADAVRTTAFHGLAPDARIFLDVPARGGVLLTLA